MCQATNLKVLNRSTGPQNKKLNIRQRLRARTCLECESKQEYANVPLWVQR